MARIAGIDLQDNLRIVFALTKIKGIGWSLSKKILKDLKIDESKRISELSSGELTKTAAKVEEFTIEGELARNVRSNISRLREIGTYRGIRHTRGLPTRGQRTRTNARIKRGKRKTVGAFKKEMLARQGTPTSEEK
ncbi:MAG TPA: 30S ribosomal protein S13 [Patescibacteria group bacterium]|nr:30S ribosomal protein S13 [Patescibacteria group bacterium]